MTISTASLNGKIMIDIVHLFPQWLDNLQISLALMSGLVVFLVIKDAYPGRKRS